MDKDILTTAEAAKILGVSTRTAQLLIEGGSVPSWKTPGGHRRVYRADVEGLIDLPLAAAAAPPSARILAVASAPRAALYRDLAVGLAEGEALVFDDPSAAERALSQAPPRILIIDIDGADPARMDQLHRLADEASGVRILAVGAGSAGDLPRARAVETPKAAFEAAREVLGQGLDKAAAAPYPLALNEAHRLVALERTGLLDTPPEEAFDRLTWLAARALEAPISLVTLLTPARQWFKSRLGLDMAETPRSWAFCNYTLMGKEVFSVEDLSADPRFADNPAVAADDGFRFYAGAPILDEDGYPVGSLCVIDRKPRVLTSDQSRALMELARMGSTEVRLRGAQRRLRQATGRGDAKAPPPAPPRRG
ncbi:excisionase family DNA-binding protein [Caulobacter segnis]|uniref:GAF domain-containing protein n=1 Tax=Caulobacter segnis TaxID=88688 RepID=UPI00240F83CA|nr:GAF domain-containing protein [Caulobacter segnis]MDG2520585.1 excisionase family DNA-binding protein [Caulobacter segnis]